MFYKRDLSNILKRYSKFPVTGIFGPRQSGKTTFVKNNFKKHKYLNFEDPNIRNFARENPKDFLKEFDNKHGIILDEFQYVPEILSYIQIDSDEKDRQGYFILTGSQNFLMNEAVTQSLAGRIGILTLLPLSINELKKNKILKDNVNNLIFNGGYPRVYSKNILPTEIYPSYIQSYLERDVRLISNVGDLDNFQKFMQLCAGRIGQLLNITDLASNCGINPKTVQSWLSILQASYIIFLLQPYYKNFNKRVIKTPKLYFYDTGLACSLLKIRSSQELALSVFKGHLFESLIISDIFKQYLALGSRVPAYFWRDLNGTIEVDCLIDLSIKQIAVEIKSGETITKNYFEGLNKWTKITESNPKNNYVIYGGDYKQKYKTGSLLGWQIAGNFIEKIEK